MNKCICFFLVLNFNILHGQNQLPTKFSDYFKISNIDSLEQFVLTQKANPLAYMHGLIALERTVAIGRIKQDKILKQSDSWQKNKNLR